MDTVRQSLRHDFITTGAFLTGVVRFNFRELLTGTCSLALQFQSKVTPSRVRDALSEVMVLQHIRDCQIFNGNLIASFKDTMGRFELKVFSVVRYLFMAACDNVPLFLSTIAAYLSSGQYALMFAEFLFRLTIVTWVINVLSFRVYNKCVKPNIYADGVLNRDFYGVGDFNNDQYVPTRSPSRDSEILDVTVRQRTVVAYLEVSDFRNNDTGVFSVDIANQAL
jgi:hypothetical protein